MVSAETLLSYPDCKLSFTVNTDASDKQLGAVIIQNTKPIAFFYRILSKPQHNYTTKLRVLQIGTATDGEEVGNSGNITIHKTGEEKGGSGASLKSNIKWWILCAEGEISEVGIPPPHN